MGRISAQQDVLVAAGLLEALAEELEGARCHAQRRTLAVAAFSPRARRTRRAERRPSSLGQVQERGLLRRSLGLADIDREIRSSRSRAGHADHQRLVARIAAVERPPRLRACSSAWAVAVAMRRGILEPPLTKLSADSARTPRM
jgi:hypothetical protein